MNRTQRMNKKTHEHCCQIQTGLNSSHSVNICAEGEYGAADTKCNSKPYMIQFLAHVVYRLQH